MVNYKLATHSAFSPQDFQRMMGLSVGFDSVFDRFFNMELLPDSRSTWFFSINFTDVIRWIPCIARYIHVEETIKNRIQSYRGCNPFLKVLGS